MGGSRLLGASQGSSRPDRTKLALSRVDGWCKDKGTIKQSQLHAFRLAQKCDSGVRLH